MLSAFLAPIGTRIFAGVSAVLLLAAIVLALWGNEGWNRAADWQARSNIEASNHRQTKDNYRLAQAEAAAKAKSAREETERRLAQLASEADNAQDSLDRLRTAAGRFADAHGVRSCRGTADSSSGRPGAPGDDQPAPDRDGQGADAVVLTRPEFDELVDNTLRLERVRQWGQSLITEGLAIPATEFGSGDPP